jgi:hypothetical protein
MGCAGCHPEGRDDGHVWHELLDAEGRPTHFVAGPTVPRLDTQLSGDTPPKYGAARQTPMLAARVDAPGHGLGLPIFIPSGEAKHHLD